jgi:hypothetical protein
MKRFVPIAAFFTTAALASAPAPANGQDLEATIERALAAAPNRSREDAAVVKWNADHTYETLKEGSNRMVCYDRSGEARRQPFAVQCTSVANLPRIAQSRRFDAESENRQESQAKVAAAEADGTRIPPEYGSVFYSMNGRDRESSGVHKTIAVPGATTESTGLPGDSSAGGAWLMNSGTTTAHIMTP